MPDGPQESSPDYDGLVMRLVDEALSRPPEERERYLRGSCPDPKVFNEAWNYVQWDERMKDFLVDPLLPSVHDQTPAEPRDPLDDSALPLFPPGAPLGVYRIEVLLGTGGSAQVYRAFDPRLGRQVALKVFAAGTVTKRFQDRFIQEARAAAGLSHPNIAVIYEVGQAAGTCFIALEYIEGETLRSKMKAAKTPLAELLGYLRQTAAALAKAHAKGIVHCDLKPDNIMVTREGFVKVLDFGLAKLIEQYKDAGPHGEQPSTTSGQTTAPLQHTGRVEGTLGYMSPEQAEGKTDLDERSDLFSFGCILFEAATGRQPFRGSPGESVVRTMHRLLYEPAPSLSELCPDAAPSLQRIVDRCLKKDPALRCPSMKEVDQDLERLLQEMQNGQAVIPASGSQSSVVADFPGDLGRHLRPPRRRKWAVPAVVAAFAILTGSIVHNPLPPARPLSSLAVIPFVNAQNTPGGDYLSDGISEALINALAHLPDLKVIARSSSFKFKGERIDLRQAARLLGVQVLVTGRVAEAGGQFRITAELVDGSDGTQIWGAHYSPTHSELPGMGATISREIAGRIRSKPTQTEQATLTKVAKVKPEAYELLLRGRYHMRLHTPETSVKAMSYYQQALAVDPGFALAHAELAHVYRLLGGSAILSSRDMMPKAEAEVHRALSADPNLAEAHAALGDIKKDRWDWGGAEAEYRRAIELSPNLPAARKGLAINLSITGRHDQAISEIQRARELDPLGVPTAVDSAAVFYNARRHAEALDVLKRALDFDPSAPAIWTWIGLVNGGTGQFVRATDAFEKAMALGDGSTATQCYYAHSLARSGRRQEALQILQRLRQPGQFVSRAALAAAYLGLDERERALQELEAAYAARDPLMQYLKIESHFDTLSSEPRFQAICAKVGLPR